MISEKKVMKRCSVFHTEQKMEFEKFNSLVKSTVVEREYTPDITRYICFAYQLAGLYDKRFY